MFPRYVWRFEAKETSDFSARWRHALGPQEAGNKAHDVQLAIGESGRYG